MSTSIKGFRILAPQSVNVDVLRRFEKQLMVKGGLRLRQLSGAPDLYFGYMDTARRIDFGVFAQNGSKCIGYVSFGKINEPVLSKIIPDLVKPHAQLMPEYQKKGVTKSFYLSMLHHGYSLVTESHTALASKLWDSIAKELHVPIMHWDRHTCEWVAAPSASTLKVLTIRDLEIK